MGRFFHPLHAYMYLSHILRHGQWVGMKVLGRRTETKYPSVPIKKGAPYSWDKFHSYDTHTVGNHFVPAAISCLLRKNKVNVSLGVNQMYFICDEIVQRCRRTCAVT